MLLSQDRNYPSQEELAFTQRQRDLLLRGKEVIFLTFDVYRRSGVPREHA